MALIEYIRNKYYCVAVWKIQETTSILLQKLNLTEKQLLKYKQIKNPLRKKQFLCTQFLLNEMTGKKYEISHNSTGKPLIINTTLNISIAHSKNFIAIILSNFTQIGIDIEEPKPKIFSIIDKFINEKERHSFNLRDINVLYLIWCAKECLYKINNQNYNFKEHIQILPFKVKHQGYFLARVNSDNFEKNYTLRYQILPEYIIVWSIDKIQKDDIQ